jgi:hypothetical protein
LLQGIHILDYPNCTEEVRPSKAKISRTKTDHLIVKRILIIFLAAVVLITLFAIMFLRSWGEKRAEHPDTELQLQEIMAEREQMLKKAIFMQNSVRRLAIYRVSHPLFVIFRNSRYADPGRLDHEFL